MRWSRSLTAGLTAGALALAACGSDDDPDPGAAPTTDPAPPAPVSPSTDPASTAPASPTPTPTATTLTGPVTAGAVTEITTNLDAPWSIAFAADDTALVSQRDAETIVAVAADGTKTEIGTVPGVEGDTEGGLLGLAFDPAAPDRLYVYATTGSTNSVLRTTYRDGSLGEFETLIDDIPASGRHNGGRMTFGPDGMLYIGTGDASDGDNAQDPSSLAGSILRVTPDGAAPPDNPDPDSPVYSYGHRNVQGLAFDDDGRLWASEFGSDEQDELNLIEPGRNYGWPVVEGIADDDRFVDPLAEWRPAEASPSGLAYVAETLFLASLRGERLWRIPLDGASIGEPEVVLDGYGRLRDAVVAPDGSLWVLTNNTDGRNEPREGDDRILRVELVRP